MGLDRVLDLDRVTAMEDMGQVTVLAKEMGQAVTVQATVNSGL